MIETINGMYYTQQEFTMACVIAVMGVLLLFFYLGFFILSSKYSKRVAYIKNRNMERNYQMIHDRIDGWRRKWQ